MGFQETPFYDQLTAEYEQAGRCLPPRSPGPILSGVGQPTQTMQRPQEVTGDAELD